MVVANRLQRNRLRCCCVVFSSMGLVLARGGHGVHVVEVEAVAQVLLAVAVVVLAVPEIRLSKGGRQGGGGVLLQDRLEGGHCCEEGTNVRGQH